MNAAVSFIIILDTKHPVADYITNQTIDALQHKSALNFHKKKLFEQLLNRLTHRVHQSRTKQVTQNKKAAHAKI